MIGAVAEEAARGGVDAIGAAAEIDAVEIELEDLVLGELALQRQRQDRFLDLAPEAAVVGQEDVARELLGDGRGRADPAALGDRRRRSRGRCRSGRRRCGCGSAGPRSRSSPRAFPAGSGRRTATCRSSARAKPGPARWRRGPGSSGRGRSAWSARRSSAGRRSRPRPRRSARAARAVPHRPALDDVMKVERPAGALMRTRTGHSGAGIESSARRDNRLGEPLRRPSVSLAINPVLASLPIEPARWALSSPRALSLAALAAAAATPWPASAQCRLCDEPPVARPDESTRRARVQLQIETSIDFDRLVLFGAGDGAAVIRPDGSSAARGAVGRIGPRAMVGTATVHGEAGPRGPD